MATKRWVDYLGISSSLLCLVHCIALPVIIVLLSGAHAHEHGHEHTHDHAGHNHAGHDHAAHAHHNHDHGAADEQRAGLLPSFEEAHSHPYAWLDYIFVALMAVAVITVSRGTKSRLVKVLLWGGLIIFSVSMLGHSLAPWMHDLHLPASGIIIVGHIINLRRGNHSHGLFGAHSCPAPAHKV